MPIKHSFQSAKADPGDNSVVGATKWNASHTVSLGNTPVSTNYSALNSDEAILGTGGASGITITLLDATTCNGLVLYIKKVDSGTGAVTIATTSSQTIDSDTSYTLGVQWQYVKLFSDGANWQVIGNN